MRNTTALACAAIVLHVAAGYAYADSCETAPGSGVYTDQCGPDAKPAQPAGAQKDAPSGGGFFDSISSHLRDLRNRLGGGGDTPASAPSGSSSSSNPYALREELKRRLSEPNSPAVWQPSSDITAAQQRVTDALSNPGAPDARARYDAAMKDLRGAYQRAFDSAPDSQLRQIQSALSRMEKSNDELAHQVNLGGFGPLDASTVAPGPAGARTSPDSTISSPANGQSPGDGAAPSTAAAPADAGGSASAGTQPAAGGAATVTSDGSSAPAANAAGGQVPDNMAVFNDRVYVCDGKVAGGNVSCSEMSAKGSDCTSVVLSDGMVGWRDSIPMQECNADALAKRDAYLAAHPDVVAQPAVFAMDAAGTQAAIARLTARPTDALDAVMDKLDVPQQCRDGLRQYVESVAHINGSPEFAQSAAEDYAKANAAPECAAKLAEVGKALKDGALKRPELDDGDIAAMKTALADEPMPSIENMRMAQPVQGPQTASSGGGGGGPGVSLDDAINILSIGTSLLNMAHTLSGGAGVPSIPSVPRVPSSTSTIRMPSSSASYPTPAPTRTPNCTYSAYDNSIFCK